MTTGTGPGSWTGSLPARQKFVPMIVPALSLTPTKGTGDGDLGLGRITALGHVLMTLQTIGVGDGERELCGLNGGMGIPGESIARPKHLRLHPPEDSRSGVTIDAARLLGGVI